MEYYTATNKSESPALVTNGSQLETIMLSDISQSPNLTHSHIQAKYTKITCKYIYSSTEQYNGD